MNQSTLLKVVSRIGFVEMFSFLLLLFVAMPLKYIFKEPFMVTVVGSAHGVLWVLYVAVIIYAAYKLKWPVLIVLLALSASILPFGPLYLHRVLQNRELEFNSHNEQI